ncbi:MAG TPA: aminoacyl-tRNA hydrolase [Gaiellales bacterium]|nr:aminoacyl-tRNA hydrolase [Gaiellales bacterium]
MSLLRRSREPSLSHLVVGLGNPGARYRDTRHNLGRRAVELIADELGGSWRSRWNGRVSELRDSDERLALLVPETFMNESGRSVAPALRFYKLPPERLVVVHDELDLELGDVRAKQGGGLAGHNGLRSLAEALGTQDFLRVRIGIGRPERGDRRPVADWVLQPFPPGTDVDRLVRDGADCTLSVLRDGVDAAMRTWNGSSTA